MGSAILHLVVSCRVSCRRTVAMERRCDVGHIPARDCRAAAKSAGRTGTLPAACGTIETEGDIFRAVTEAHFSSVSHDDHLAVRLWPQRAGGHVAGDGVHLITTHPAGEYL